MLADPDKKVVNHLASLLASCRIRLADATTLQEVIDVVRVGARALLAAQGATFVLRDGDQCFYADEDSIAPLWKGQRFPIEQCISGWAMLHGAPAVVPDITVDPRIPQEAYRATYITSLVMVPIRRRDPVGAVGVYWSGRHAATGSEVVDLEELAEMAADRLDRIGLADAPWAPTFGDHSRR